jgi:hypothetical protein
MPYCLLKSWSLNEYQFYTKLSTAWGPPSWCRTQLELPKEDVKNLISMSLSALKACSRHR